MSAAIAIRSNWGLRLYRLTLVVFASVAVVWTIYVAIQLQKIDAVEVRTVVVETDNRELRREFAAFKAEAIDHFDEVDRVLFGEVLAKIKIKPPANKVEQWLINRDKELRTRLERIERRLMHIEGRE